LRTPRSQPQLSFRHPQARRGSRLTDLRCRCSNRTTGE
jgi:hypothetical protein